MERPHIDGDEKSGAYYIALMRKILDGTATPKEIAGSKNLPPEIDVASPPNDARIPKWVIEEAKNRARGLPPDSQ